MPAWPSVAVAVVALVCYLAACPPVPGDKDGPEFTLVLATLGLAHPTGYPLYTLLGHPFVCALHAAGASWAYAANAWSAAGAALALGLLHALAARLAASAGVRPRASAAVALVPVAALALDPVWTSEATLAEVNSWHVAWVAGAALFAAAVMRRADASGAGARVRDAAVWGLLCGLGLAHHRTSVLPAAPLTLALLARLRPARPSVYAAAVAGALVPLLSYAYVAWRGSHPAAAQWPASGAGLAAAWEFTSGGGYAHFLGRFAPSNPQRVLLSRFVFPLLAPAALGALAWPFARAGAPRALRAGLAAAVAVQLAGAFLYGVPDPAAYFLPPMALGLAVVPAWLASFAAVRRVGTPLALGSALAVAAAAATWPRIAAERYQTFVRFDRLARSMWASIPGDRGFVLWEDDMWYRLLGYQQLDGVKPGLVVVDPVLIAHPRARRAFATRHGFDPLETLPPGAATSGEGEALDPLRAALVDRLVRTGEPVYVFLPEVGSVRLLHNGAAAGR